MRRTLQTFWLRTFQFGVLTIISLLICSTSLMAAPMIGNYTVGTGSGYDFSSISQSIDSLTINGISGPIVIQIAADTFNEQLNITSIPGSSPTNTITFKGKGKTTLIYYSPTSSSRAIVSFNGTSHIIFDSLQVEAKGSYGIGFNYHNEADSITVQNCYVKLPNTSSANNCAGFANYPSNGGSGSDIVKHLVISNDTIEGGFEGVHLIGNSSTENHYLIENNTMLQFGLAGITVSGSIGVDILGNYMLSTVSTARFAISMWPTAQSIHIIGNDVELGSNDDHTRVFQIAGPPGSGASSFSDGILIANNYVKYSGSYTANITGIYIKHVNYLEIYNNTVRMVSGSGAKSLWLDALNSTSNILVYNNNLANDVSNGELFRTHNLISADVDFNNYYNASGFKVVFKGTTYTTLAAYQSGTSMAANGVIVDPKFISTTDLHIDTSNYQFDGLGTPVSSVTTDFDNETRNGTRPDIGADEFSSGTDVSLGNIVSPLPCGSPSPAKTIAVTIKNNSPRAVSGIPVSYQINSDPPVNEVYTSTIASNDSAVHYFTQNGVMKSPGIYAMRFYVDLKADNDLSNDTILANIPISDLTLFLPDSFGACTNQDLIIDPKTKSAVSYKWSDNSTQSSLVLKGSSIGVGSSYYWVEASDANGCSLSDTIKVIFSKPAVVRLGNDTTLCEGAVINLDVTNPGATYSWQDQNTNPQYTVDTTGLYFVDVSTGFQCVMTDSIKVAYSLLSDIGFKDSITICDGSSKILYPTGIFTSYKWHDGSTADSFEAVKEGLHWVIASDSIGCVASDSTEILVNNIPQFNLGTDTSICFGENVILDAGKDNSTYKWQDASTDSILIAELSGIYWVIVTNQNNCSTVDTIRVIVNPNPTLNIPDTAICSNASLALDISQNNASYLWSDGSTSSVLLIENEGAFWAELQDSNGCTTRDSFNLSVNLSPVFSLGADTVLGIRELKVASHKLEIASGYKSYLWSTGNQTNSILIDDSYKVGAHVISALVTADNDCQASDTVNIKIHDNIGITNHHKLDIVVSPNPSNAVFNLSFGFQIDDVTINVYNGMGQKVESNILQLHGRNQTKVDLSGQPNGIYLLIIKFEDKEYVHKLVLSK